MSQLWGMCHTSHRHRHRAMRGTRLSDLQILPRRHSKASYFWLPRGWKRSEPCPFIVNSGNFLHFVGLHMFSTSIHVPTSSSWMKKPGSLCHTWEVKMAKARLRILELQWLGMDMHGPSKRIMIKRVWYVIFKALSTQSSSRALFNSTFYGPIFIHFHQCSYFHPFYHILSIFSVRILTHCSLSVQPALLYHLWVVWLCEMAPGSQQCISLLGGGCFCLYTSGCSAAVP